MWATNRIVSSWRYLDAGPRLPFWDFRVNNLAYNFGYLSLVDESGQEGASTQWKDSDDELYDELYKCDRRWTTKYMVEIPPGWPYPNNGCCKLDPETHDRINSVWLFLLFDATCSLALDANFLGTELGIWKLGLGLKKRDSGSKVDFMGLRVKIWVTWSISDPRCHASLK